jgi:hypothetical protein
VDGWFRMIAHFDYAEIEAVRGWPGSILIPEPRDFTMKHDALIRDPHSSPALIP